MDFFTVPTPSGSLLLVAQGEIKEGDDRRLHEFVAALPLHSKLYAVGLDSPGGDLREGVYLAKSIRSSGLPTIVASRGMCASACFLMFAAGKPRMAAINARVGVHSASASGEDNGPAQAVTTLMARQAGEFGVPPAIIGKMVTTPPSDITWLGQADLASMNVETLPSDDNTYMPGTELVPGSSAPAGDPKPVGFAPAPNPASAPNVATTPDPTPASSGAFAAGRSDRAAFEQWLGKLDGRTASGARWWTANRSRQGASCQAVADPSDPAFTAGCEEASRRLAPLDQRRLSEPTYRAGWNSF